MHRWECADKNYSWVNSKITFDHVGHAYLALFQVMIVITVVTIALILTMDFCRWQPLRAGWR